MPPQDGPAAGADPERAARERWLRVERIFDEATELPASEVAAYVDRACAGDDEVRREVGELLAAHRAAGEGFLSAPAAAALGADAAAAAAATAPERVGVWRLLGLLGEGGMGRVYLAERADGAFEQRAAVKLLKPGLLARGAAARFLRERQILARLEHPGIARLLDGGLAGDGTPYFALEHVEGEPITAWCERRGAPVGERLHLFLAVCAAVAAAHRSLVVHRDLKPSNILVTAAGEVKLLDFGIAKPLEQADETRTLERALTPEYAAPEQIVGGVVTTATDVYSLGALLYELLTGRVPHPWSGATSLFDFEQRVVSRDPERPSTVAAAAGRRLDGDLDAIVLKALRKEPAERYASVEALATDVERFLAGRPVAARGGASAYRLRKFVWRHRPGLAAAALVLMAVAGGVAATLWQAERARAEAAKSKGIADFMIGLFTANDPREARGRERTARQLLDLGAQRVDSELAGEPEVQAEVYRRIGEVYRALGEHGKAAEMAGRHLGLVERLYGAKSPQGIAARIFAGNMDLELGRYPEAEVAFRRILAEETAERGGRSAVAGEAMVGLGGALHAQGRLEEAERVLVPAHELLAATAGPTDERTLEVANNLGVLFSDQGRLAEAERVEREYLEGLEGLHGPDDPAVLLAGYNLAATVMRRGRFIEAERRFRDLEPILRKVEGHHPLLARVLQRHATTLDELARPAEAGALLAESAAIADAADWEGERAAQSVLEALHALATGDAGSAEARLRSALAFFAGTLGEGSATTALLRATHARALAGQGRYGEARAEIEPALAVLRTASGRTHPDTLYFESEDGAILLALGERAGAERLLARVAGDQRRILGPDHPDLARTLERWAAALPAGPAGRRSELLEEALAIIRRALPPGHPRVRELESEFARAGDAAVAPPADAPPAHPADSLAGPPEAE